ncbi:pilus assembly PilX family protein [Oceanisphaera sp. W20_SRM_FM3]|uniref:pilus assembly PilX family protein n=1 Tax=Oceanisphaera sp. W20_SRM_FM3 TaxID=3240267 RepID=UPI003F9DE87B
MRHNHSLHIHQSLRRKQGGSMLLIVVFMMVVLALLVTTMGSFLSDSSQKTSVEVRATRALMAAQSGLEYGFYKVGNADKSDPTAVKAICEAIAIDEDSLPLNDIKGFTDCHAIVTCTAIDDTKTYSITSEGRCGEPLTASHSKDDTRTDFAVSRTLTAEAQ